MEVGNQHSVLNEPFLIWCLPQFHSSLCQKGSYPKQPHFVTLQLPVTQWFKNLLMGRERGDRTHRTWGFSLYFKIPQGKYLNYRIFFFNIGRYACTNYSCSFSHHSFTLNTLKSQNEDLPFSQGQSWAHWKQLEMDRTCCLLPAWNPLPQGFTSWPTWSGYILYSTGGELLGTAKCHSSAMHNSQWECRKHLCFVGSPYGFKKGMYRQVTTEASGLGRVGNERIAASSRNYKLWYRNAQKQSALSSTHTPKFCRNPFH